MQELTIENIKARLEQLSIFELRQTARAVGVACPAAGTKDEVRGKVIAIANGTDTPVTLNNFPFEGWVDKGLVKDILIFRESIIGKN